MGKKMISFPPDHWKGAANFDLLEHQRHILAHMKASQSQRDGQLVKALDEFEKVMGIGGPKPGEVVWQKTSTDEPVLQEIVIDYNNHAFFKLKSLTEEEKPVTPPAKTAPLQFINGDWIDTPPPKDGGRSPTSGPSRS